jgi:hypothetical protein
MRCLCSVIDFATKDDMKRALRKLDNTELNGKHVRLRTEVSTKYFMGSYRKVSPGLNVFQLRGLSAVRLFQR